MYSESFEASLQKLHNFDFINGKIMSRAGNKYYEEITKISYELASNSSIYDEDD